MARACPWTIALALLLLTTTFCADAVAAANGTFIVSPNSPQAAERPTLASPIRRRRLLTDPDNLPAGWWGTFVSSLTSKFLPSTPPAPGCGNQGVNWSVWCEAGNLYAPKAPKTFTTAPYKLPDDSYLASRTPDARGKGTVINYGGPLYDKLSNFLPPAWKSGASTSSDQLSLSPSLSEPVAKRNRAARLEVQASCTGKCILQLKLVQQDSKLLHGLDSLM